MKTFYRILPCILLIATWGCKTTTDPFKQQGVDLYGKDLPATLTAYDAVKEGRDPILNPGTPAMYVDFSAGMYTAFGTPAIKELMSQCFNTVLAQQFSVFKLVQGQVTSIQVSNSTELGQIVNDPKQYLDRRAPIQAAVEKIVTEKKDALLITDFEEWQSNAEVISTAYLKIPFSKWLRDGNSISFFISDYKEGMADKHIYFTVFTYGRPSENSLISKLRSKLVILPNHFDLATDAYRLTTDYPGPNTGGIFRDEKGNTEKDRNVLDLQPGYFGGPIQNKDLEYYPLGVNWETVEQLRKDYGQEKFADLFRRLYIDLTNTDSYIYDNFEVTSDDVTADFERYAKSVELAKHKPRIVKGANGENKFAEDETDAIALNCYNTDGQVKSAFRYEPQSLQIINDAFILNNALFTNTLRSDKRKVELGVSLTPQFAANLLPDPKGLIRVVIRLKGATVNLGSPVLEQFKWLNPVGISNTALYESIKGTLDELKPVHQPIYTYYIKTTE